MLNLINLTFISLTAIPKKQTVTRFTALLQDLAVGLQDQEFPGLLEDDKLLRADRDREFWCLHVFKVRDRQALPDSPWLERVNELNLGVDIGESEGLTGTTEDIEFAVHAAARMARSHALHRRQISPCAHPSVVNFCVTASGNVLLAPARTENVAICVLAQRGVASASIHIRAAKFLEKTRLFLKLKAVQFT